jgi:hypothetical protein
MSGHHPFAELIKDHTPERRERIAAAVAALRESESLKAQERSTPATQHVSDQNFRS